VTDRKVLLWDALRALADAAVTVKLFPAEENERIVALVRCAAREIHERVAFRDIGLSREDVAFIDSCYPPTAVDLVALRKLANVLGNGMVFFQFPDDALLLDDAADLIEELRALQMAQEDPQKDSQKDSRDGEGSTGSSDEGSSDASR